MSFLHCSCQGVRVLAISLLIVFFSVNSGVAEGIYLDFNDFPVTTGSVPGDSPDWEYSSSVTNDYGYTESKSSGWKSKTKWSDGWNWFWDHNRNGYCQSHMGGGDTYGYLDITDGGHIGNALRYSVTGGLEFTDTHPCQGVPLGTELYNKESYTGPSDIYTGGDPLGHMYLYFKKIDVLGSSQDFSPYQVIGNSNRFYFYIYLPEATSNGTGGYNSNVKQTFQVGTFQNAIPPHHGHHYQNVYTQGGGWTKVQIDETTNGDNSGNGATRHIPGFLTTLYQYYLTTVPYAGSVAPPYEILVDTIGFEEDTYTAQNNDTISNMAVLYRTADQSWEISLNDKYKNHADAHATYEVRYSLSAPITNENWNDATPVEIQEDTRFYIQARNDGKFQKWWPYYQGVWAPFKLTQTDTANLSPGATVFFAVKDISQNPADLQTPVDGINGYWGAGKGGRPYGDAHFDFASDEAALPLIKRISYTIGSATPPETGPKAPSGLKVNKTE